MVMEYFTLLQPLERLWGKAREFSPRHALELCLRSCTQYDNLDPTAKHQVKDRLLRGLSFVELSPFRYEDHARPFCLTAIDSVYSGRGTEDRKPTKVTIPFVIPVDPCQLHVFILIKALDLSLLGAEVIMLLEDRTYTKLASLKHKKRITAHAATQYFKRCMRQLVGELSHRYGANTVKRISLVCQSELADMPLGRNGLGEMEEILSLIKIDGTFIKATKKLAMLKTSKQVTAHDVVSVLESYVLAATETRPNFIMVGRDRIPLYKILENVLKTQNHRDWKPPTVLSWKPIPNRAGKLQWSLDDPDNFYPFKGEEIGRVTRSDKRFRKWFTQEVQSRWTEGIVDAESLSSLRVPRETAPTLRDLCSRFLDENPSAVFSIILFGSDLRAADEPLNPRRIGMETRKSLEGDVDLIFVVQSKTNRIRKRIEELLVPYGTVVHHPDFYSIRDTPERIFEVIVLPKGTDFLAKERLGILTGLSVFPEGRYEVLAGEAVQKVITVPTSGVADRETRLRTYLHSQYGLKDLQCRLWSHLPRTCVPFDVRRVLRFLLIDSIWVETGEWKFDLGSLETYARSMEVPQDLKEFTINALRGTWMPRSASGREAVEKLYRVVCSLETSLKCEPKNGAGADR